MSTDNNSLELKYGCNPNQKPSRIFMQQGELPIEVRLMPVPAVPTVCRRTAILSH